MHQLPQPNPRGILALTGLEERLQAAEDARAVADKNVHTVLRSFTRIPGHRLAQLHSAQDGKPLTAFTRPATDTERHLLNTLGYELPEELTTAVHYRNSATRFRWWPQLERKPPVSLQTISTATAR